MILLLLGGCKIDWSQLTPTQKTEVERYLSKEQCHQAPEIDVDGTVLYFSLLGLIILFQKEKHRI